MQYRGSLWFAQNPRKKIYYILLLLMSGWKDLYEALVFRLEGEVAKLAESSAKLAQAEISMQEQRDVMVRLQAEAVVMKAAAIVMKDEAADMQRTIQSYEEKEQRKNEEEKKHVEEEEEKRNEEEDMAKKMQAAKSAMTLLQKGQNSIVRQIDRVLESSMERLVDAGDKIALQNAWNGIHRMLTIQNVTGWFKGFLVYFEALKKLVRVKRD